MNDQARRRPVGYTILKMGGSLITNKDIPLSLNKKNVRSIAAALIKGTRKKSHENSPLILVHGGGSFGHYYAKQYGLSKKSAHVSPLGIAQTEEGMLELHYKIIKIFLENNIPTETILPSELLSDDLSRVSKKGKEHIFRSIGGGLFPITFGYVAVGKNTACIISGDQICEALTNSLSVKRVIFAMDVDGIFANFDLKGDIISKLSRASEIRTKSSRYDVTGGIEAKLKVGYELCRHGAQVFYVNGTKPNRVAKLLAGEVEPLATEIVA